MEEDSSFSQHETETWYSVLGTLIRSFLYHTPSQINHRSLKQSYSIRVALYKGEIA
jgi:hypothetical protein